MWTPTTRRRHSRAGLRHETDLTDAGWALIGPLMPAPATCGRPPVWAKREILNAIFYVLRDALVDTGGRALVLDPQPADVQDRDGAVPVLRPSRRTFPLITKAFADAGYAGDRPATATIITVEIVRKPPGQVGCAVHPRRWVVDPSTGSG